jgi:hypothetical protein
MNRCERVYGTQTTTPLGELQSMHNGCHSTKALQISRLMIPHGKRLAGHVKELDER